MNLTTMSGEYRFTVLDSNGRIKRETDWMPNLITNIGLDQIGLRSTIGTYCRIGTGNTPPAFTDTQLVSQSASTGTTAGSSNVNNGAPNYETVMSQTYQFAQGAVVGNMAEVGVGWATTGATLFSRALIVDAVGTPTTISVLSSEILQVTYRFKVYPQLTDSTGSVSIGAETYTYTARAGNISTTKNNFPANLWSSITCAVYAGLIGPITGTPAGTSAAISNASFSTYTPGTYFIEFTHTASLTQGNVTGGFRSLSVNSNLAYTQMEFDRPILKDNTKQFSILFRHAFGRR